GNGIPVTGIQETSYPLSGLSANTAYEFYVRADCGNRKSEWTGPFGFTTLGGCPSGSFTLTTQQQIDDFGAMYAHCTDITLNSLTIGFLLGPNATDITDLTPLQNISSINGTLYIYYNPLLSDLNGLNGITNIAGSLTIFANSVMTNIDGLNNLTSIGGNLSIRFNPQLTNLEALNSLTSIGGDLSITNNIALTDISGLQNIDPSTIGGTSGLRIVNNPLLAVCNLPNFCAYLQGSGPRAISGNKTTCLNEAAVQAECAPCETPGNLSV